MHCPGTSTVAGTVHPPCSGHPRAPAAQPQTLSGTGREDGLHSQQTRTSLPPPQLWSSKSPRQVSPASILPRALPPPAPLPAPPIPVHLRPEPSRGACPQPGPPHRTAPDPAPDRSCARSARPGTRTQHRKSCPVMSQHPVLSTRTLRWGTQHLVCGPKTPNPAPEPRTPPVAGPDPISPALACGAARFGPVPPGAARRWLSCPPQVAVRGPAVGRAVPCRAARTTAPPAGRPARRAPPRGCEGRGPEVLRGPERRAAGVTSKSRSTPA